MLVCKSRPAPGHVTKCPGWLRQLIFLYCLLLSTLPSEVCWTLCSARFFFNMYKPAYLLYVDKAKCVCFCMTHTKQPIQQPTCVAALQMFLFCWVLYYLPHMPPGLYLWWRQSLWLGLQFQSCKSNECLSENITKRLTPLQLNAICGLINFFVDPLTPWSAALWIQLVLLWSQLHPQQPCGEHNHPACQLTFHTYAPTINTPPSRTRLPISGSSSRNISEKWE